MVLQTSDGPVDAAAAPTGTDGLTSTDTIAGSADPNASHGPTGYSLSYRFCWSYWY